MPSINSEGKCICTVIFSHLSLNVTLQQHCKYLLWMIFCSFSKRAQTLSLTQSILSRRSCSLFFNNYLYNSCQLYTNYQIKSVTVLGSIEIFEVLHEQRRYNYTFIIIHCDTTDNQNHLDSQYWIINVGQTNEKQQENLHLLYSFPGCTFSYRPFLPPTVK